MNNSKTYCVMPHKGLALQNHGDFCVCNINDMSFENSKWETMYVHNTNLKDAWKSHTRKMIAIALDKGRELPACKQCYDLEVSNKPSSRKTFNARFADVPEMSTQPRVFVLKPGNTCNLACRMCNPATSSGWYKDAYQLELLDQKYTGTYQEYTKTFEHVRNSFNRDNIEFWQTFTEWLPNLSFVDIYGGEPFLTPALFDALDTVAKSGQAGNTSIQLHTNATVINEKYFEILSHYKSVSLGLSVDSDRAQELEYIRYPIVADNLFANLEKIKAYTPIYKNIYFKITTTVTPLNVLRIEQIQQNLKKYFNAGLNFVTSPEEYDIRHIPLPVRKLIAEKNPSVAKFILQTIPGCDVQWPRFWKHTKDLDRLRGQNFETTFPEFFELIKPYVDV